MKFAPFMLVAAAVFGCLALSWTMANPTATAQSPTTPDRPLVFVPGLLGSKLCGIDDAGKEVVVWGSVEALGQFPALALRTAGDELEPCGLIREVSFLGIFTQSVYAPFIERLEGAGYREGETLFVFDYDWRRSVFENAGRLADFVDEVIPDNRAIDLVGHSMGGLVARTYIHDRGRDRVARLVSAGTPWRGSVQLFQLLRDGWGLVTPILGGVENFRRTILTFPSILELVPTYDGCCDDGSSKPVVFDVADPEAWLALNWPGVDAHELPDLTDAEARQKELRTLIAAPLPSGVEEALVIGVDQRTPQAYDLGFGDGEAQLTISSSWEGDGTVMRDSASLAHRVVYPTSFATHDAVLSDALVQDFVLAVLRDGPAAAAETVPVRERTSILTALGTLVELVGVSIATDQPAYSTGALAKVTVHLRLGVSAPLDPASILMTVVMPDGAARQVPLMPNPTASDPSIPLEQSFTGEVEVGSESGSLQIAVAIDATGAEPRAMTHIVPVVGL